MKRIKDAAIATLMVLAACIVANIITLAVFGVLPA
jgi:hypothetical protein